MAREREGVKLTGIFSLQPSVMVPTNPPSAYGLTPNRLPVSSYSAKARLLIPTDSGMIASGPASATRPRSEREQRPQCLEGITVNGSDTEENSNPSESHKGENHRDGNHRDGNHRDGNQALKILNKNTKDKNIILSFDLNSKIEGKQDKNSRYVPLAEKLASINKDVDFRKLSFLYYQALSRGQLFFYLHLSLLQK
jgi:hypothetical protein